VDICASSILDSRRRFHTLKLARMARNTFILRHSHYVERQVSYQYITSYGGYDDCYDGDCLLFDNFDVAADAVADSL